MLQVDLVANTFILLMLLIATFASFHHCVYYPLHVQGKQNSSNSAVINYKCHVAGKDVISRHLMLTLSSSSFRMKA